MTYHVYILTNEQRTLYTGVTSNLISRIEQHNLGIGSKFAQRHKTNKLVYAEEASTRMEAVEREKQIKHWRRSKKIDLIESINPNWLDLIHIGGTNTGA
jgi:putative endonuclease